MSKQDKGRLWPAALLLRSLLSEAMDLHIWANNIALVTHLNGILSFAVPSVAADRLSVRPSLS
jgi:hypothetical protein